MVTARFARSGETADRTIQARLMRLGNAARNWTVVSSDRSVQVSARAARAQVVAAEEFARQLVQTLRGGERGATPAGRAADGGLSGEEVDDWLRLFGEDGAERGNVRD
jgi:hypothetical protein